MCRLAIILTTLCILSTAASAACSPGRMHDDFRFCMKTGQGQIQGRNIMWDGLKSYQAFVIMQGFQACEGGRGPDGSSAAQNGWECFLTNQVDALKLAQQIAAEGIRARKRTK